MTTSVALFFVPGWTFVTGSPHLAIPLLSAFLRKNGVNVRSRDLNIELAKTLHTNVADSDASDACNSPTLERLNHPYFEAEDKLMLLARQYQGTWNAQLGFSYDDTPHLSSMLSIASGNRSSPYDSLYAEAINEIDKDQPSIIGLTVASIYQIIPAWQFSKRLRSNGYEGFIVWGGNTVSRLRSEMAIPKVFDIVDGLISFQGESALLSLCHALESQEDLSTVPELTWRDNEKHIRYNNVPTALNPDCVPTPDYTGLPVGEYWGKNYVNIVASRGCYYGRCSFCAIPYGWGNNGYAGTRAPNLVVRDMVDLIQRYGIRRFKFVDEALSPNFMRALSNQLINEGLKVEWEGYVRFESSWYDQNFVDHVSKAGFRKGYFGLELIPSENRALMGKRDTPQPHRLLATCQAAGIKVHLFCMFGFPGTGEREAAETVEFLLNQSDTIDTADIFPWTYAKHTNVAGVVPYTDPTQDWALEFDHAGTRQGVLSSEEVRELANNYEELLWREVPRFLHPTYRLVSPWS